MANPELQENPDVALKRLEILRALLDSSGTLIAQADLKSLFNELANCFKRLGHQMVGLSLADPDGQLKPYRTAFSSSNFGPESVGFSGADDPVAEAVREKRPISRSGSDYSGFSAEIALRLKKENIRSI